MTAVDTSILVYARRKESPQHKRALAALRPLAEGLRPWASPMFVMGKFLPALGVATLDGSPTSDRP